MIKRLLVVFGEPESDDPQAYLMEIAHITKGVSPDILAEACTHLMKHHKGRQFPTPAQCLAACDHAAEQRGLADKRKPLMLVNDEWTRNAVDRADGLIRGPLGQQAASDGWVLGLHDFCRKRGRLPQMHEITKIKASGRDFDDAYREAQMIKGSMGKALVKLGDTMLARRDRCGRVVDGEVLP